MPTTCDLWLTSAPFARALALREGRLVLAPNSRASRSLAVAPLSLQQLAQRLLRKAGLIPIEALTKSQILVELSGKLGYSDPVGASRRFSPVLSELLRAGLDLAELAKFDDARVREVARFASSYVQKLRERGRFDSAEIFWLAAKRKESLATILVTGYPRLGRDEEHFIMAIANPGSAIVLPFAEFDHYLENEHLAQRFEESGWSIHREAAEAERPVQVLGWQFANQEAEVRGVLAHVKALLTDGISASEVAIVARDDAAYGPLILAIAEEHGIPIRAEYQVPLERTRFGHWLGLLAETIEDDLQFESTFRLLNHPLCDALDAEARAEARQTHPKGLAKWSSLCKAAASLDWPEVSTRGEWRERLLHLLSELKIARRARTWASETIALDRFRRALDQVGTADSLPLEREAFLVELRDLLTLLTTPAHPARGGVPLHTPLAMFGARVKHLFVLGAAEDHFPARLNDDPVLDFAVRKRLAAAGFSLETASAAARRERLTFDSALGNATESLTLAYPRMAEGKLRLPSPAFGWLGLAPLEPEVPIASVEEGRRIKIFQSHSSEADPVLAHAQEALTAELRRESRGQLVDQNPHDGYTGLPVPWQQWTFSATQLSTLGQCAFKWYAQRVLGIKAMDEASDDLDHSARGKLYHKTLELACEAGKNAIDLRQGVLENLERAMLQAEEAIAPELGYHPRELSTWEVRREEHLQVLRQAVQHEGFAEAGSSLAATELKFKSTWRGFPIKGQVDRVDTVGDSLTVIDYKAGSSIYGKAQDAERKATIDVQLPIYAEAVSASLFPGRSVGGAFYYTLSTPKRHPSKVEEKELEGLVERLKSFLETGHFPVAPDIKQEACKYCEQKIVCRAGARLGRKEA